MSEDVGQNARGDWDALAEDVGDDAKASAARRRARVEEAAHRAQTLVGRHPAPARPPVTSARTIATYSTAAEAERAAEWLSAQGFAVEIHADRYDLQVDADDADEARRVLGEMPATS